MTSLRELPIHSLQFYLTAPYPCSYLPEREARSQVATPHHLIDTTIYTEQVWRGFRRSGLFVYRPRCGACRACVAIRVPVAEFQPNRSQRRCAARNADIEVILKPLAFDETHYRLYRRYQLARHSGGGMDNDDREQYRSFLLQSRVDSVLAEFSLNGEVVMVALADRLLDGLSAVYTFFEPTLSKRSLGVYGVLTQIQLAQRLGLRYVYLGYWIADSQKMGYKRDYQPAEILQGDAWQRCDERKA